MLLCFFCLFLSARVSLSFWGIILSTSTTALYTALKIFDLSKSTSLPSLLITIIASDLSYYSISFEIGYVLYHKIITSV